MDLQPLRIDRSRAAPRRARGSGALSRAWPALAGVGLLALLLGQPVLRQLASFGRVTVRTREVERRSALEAGAIQGLAANGYVVAARRAALSADTPGRIVEMRVSEGSKVSKGEVVARLYAAEYEAALARAAAEVEVARAALSQAQAAGQAARADLERLRAAASAAEQLRASNEAEQERAEAESRRVAALLEAGVLTTRDEESARAARDSARALLQSADSQAAAARASVEAGQSQVAMAEADVALGEARLRAAEAARDQAAATLSKTEVRAPFDGVVVLKDAEVGEVVSPNVAGGSTARGSVVTLVDFASLEVQTDLPETSLGGVRLGGPVRIFLDAWPDRPYEGRVERIWPTANRQKGTVEVRASFAAPDDLLRPDMGVRVVFLPEGQDPGAAAPQGPAVLIPESALVRQEGGSGAFLLEEGRVRFQPLRLGERRGGNAVVEEGLVGGEMVVVDPPAELEDGDRVQAEERP